MMENPDLRRWLELRPDLYCLLGSRMGECSHSDCLDLLAALKHHDPRILGQALEEITSRYWDSIGKGKPVDPMNLARSITGREPKWTILKEEYCQDCLGPIRYIDVISGREIVNLQIAQYFCCENPLCRCYSEAKVIFLRD